MTTTVIDPNIGTPNALSTNKVVATLTTDDSDGKGAWDEVLLTPGVDALTFTLPLVSTAKGKQYAVRLVSTGGGTAKVAAYAAAGTDTIEGASSYTMPAVGAGIILHNDGVNKWYIVGYYPASGTAYTLPAATGSVLGGTKIGGTAPTPSAPVVPVVQADGFVDDSYVDFGAAVPGAVPVATSAVLGKVKITGTPADAANPTAPVLQTGGKIPATTLPIAAAGTIGGVMIIGTPSPATEPKVPVIEAGPYTGDVALAQITLGGAPGSLTVINGIITAVVAPT